MLISHCLGATLELFEADWKLSKIDLNLFNSMTLSKQLDSSYAVASHFLISCLTSVVIVTIC